MKERTKKKEESETLIPIELQTNPFRIIYDILVVAPYILLLVGLHAKMHF